MSRTLTLASIATLFACGCPSGMSPRDGGVGDRALGDGTSCSACPELCKLTDCTRLLFDPEDYDDDGSKDSNDNCRWVANKGQQDSDGDGIGDTCDNCPNLANKDQRDQEGDGLGDSCDGDADNDGVPNSKDSCPLTTNPAQTDTDMDKLGDACDADADGDGVPNSQDNCPLVANPDQKNTDPNTYGEACDKDADKDGIQDGTDNCPTVANPDQKDTDHDNLGDACDSDLDNDGAPNILDNCPMVANADQKDSDRDNKGDACDSRFCLVLNGDEPNCLDPNSTFRVYSPSKSLGTGEAYLLPLFMNRSGVAASYTWTMELRPVGSRAVLFNGQGSCGSSTSYLCGYGTAKPAGVFLDRVGEYRLKITAELTQPDPLNPSFPRQSSYVVSLHAQGTDLCIPEGCAK